MGATVHHLDQSWLDQSTAADSGAALRAFYSQARNRDWGLRTRIWTVIGCAVSAWALVFGLGALVMLRPRKRMT